MADFDIMMRLMLFSYFFRFHKAPLAFAASEGARFAETTRSAGHLRGLMMLAYIS